MVEIINLNKVRKARKKADKKRRAPTNRAKFGQSRTARKRQETDRARLDKDLNGKQLPDDSKSTDT